ncbi:MAG: hypothetical protein NTZ42_02390 [Candidatus Gribaldobacteria bacterium]|nr:hypothetical protein [Candidatus Gribaldobacteria bacterium]
MNRDEIINNCRTLLAAYKNGGLGQTTMPEESHPEFADNEIEERLAYFTLPMALNYQRDSYKLWQAALATYNDEATKKVFSLSEAAAMNPADLRERLTKYRLALQPNRHIEIWQKIAKTIFQKWQTLENLLRAADYDFLQLRDIIQKEYRQGFPYLSGPKIFNYWSFIISTYGQSPLTNRDFIEIAPDTHIIKCSVLLGVITEDEAQKLSKSQISQRWRELLDGYCPY